MIKNCVVCGFPFEAKSNKKTCSESCSRELDKAKYKRYNLKNREKRLAFTREWRAKNPERVKELNQLHHALILRQFREDRKEIIKILGSKCIKCGFSDIRTLQIDHVHGNGRKERGKTNAFYYYKRILKEIKAGSKDYQILCANCNWIKRDENNENPSQSM